MKYRIEWESMETGHRGHGQPSDNHGMLSTWVRAMTVKHQTIKHAVVLYEGDEKPCNH